MEALSIKANVQRPKCRPETWAYRLYADIVIVQKFFAYIFSETGQIWTKLNRWMGWGRVSLRNYRRPKSMKKCSSPLSMSLDWSRRRRDQSRDMERGDENFFMLLGQEQTIRSLRLIAENHGKKCQHYGTLCDKSPIVTVKLRHQFVTFVQQNVTLVPKSTAEVKAKQHCLVLIL